MDFFSIFFIMKPYCVFSLELIFENSSFYNMNISRIIPLPYYL